MATGDFWNLDDPLKPWGLFDKDDVITIPFDFSEWLTGQGTTRVSHNLTAAPELDVVTLSSDNGIVRVQVSKDAAATLVQNVKYGVTCQVVAADGQKRSMTLYLKVREL